MEKENFIWDIYQDFVLSREAKLCTEATMDFYRFTVGKFVEFLNGRTPTAKDIREYLASLEGLTDRSVFAHASGIRTFLRFSHAEGYLPEIRIDMPKVAKKRQPSLDADQLRRVIAVAQTNRDKAIVMVLADTGLRNAELLSLTWENIDFNTGLVRVVGKGRKHRSIIIGAKARRALLKHRRSDGRTGQVFKLRPAGLRQVFRRLSKRACIYCTPHILRRTFATLYLRGQGDVVTLQALLGHSSLETTRQYVYLTDEDLVSAHRRCSPIDNL